MNPVDPKYRPTHPYCGMCGGAKRRSTTRARPALICPKCDAAGLQTIDDFKWGGPMVLKP